MDTKGIDQMLGVLRATAAQAGGRTSEAQASEAGSTDFANVLQLWLHLAHRKGAGDIGKVTVFARSPIEEQQVAFLEEALGGCCVWVGAVRSAAGSTGCGPPRYSGPCRSGP